MTASGIAKMASVGRAAVSNWRRRYADFPLPTGGTTASPVFDAASVEQWLQRQGKLQAASTAEKLWRLVEGFSPAARIGEALCITGAYLLAQSWQAKPGLPTPKQLVTRLRARDKHLAQLVGALLPDQWSAQHESMLHLAALAARESDPDAAFEHLHGQYAGSARSLTGPDATPEAVAEIMLALAGTGEEIFDFTCGTGSILRVAAEQALSRGRTINCLAQEVKPQHALTTLLRLWFIHDRAVAAGLPAAPPVVSVGDSLLDDRFADLTADVVVANPPFGIHDWGHERLSYDPRWTFGVPPRTEPELAWVQHALAHLAPGKTAVLLMPPAAAARSAGKRIRTELVRRGALQAVIALPPGMLLPAAIGLHLWVFTNSPAGPSTSPRLLFVDSTMAAGAQGSAASRSASARAVREIVTRAWKAYQARGTHPGEAGVFRIVPAVDVLDNEVDLTPRRHLPLTGRQGLDHRQTRERIKTFGGLLDEARAGLPAVSEVVSVSVSRAAMADIADLLRSGSLSIHRAVNRARGTTAVGARAVEVTVLTGSDVLAGGPPTGMMTLAADRDPETCVAAGDVLVPIVAREVVARVATPDQIGAELGLGVHAIRADPDVIDPWFLTGVLSRADNTRIAGRAATTTSGVIRIDVRRLAVPVLPIEEQRAYGDAFRRLAQFQTTLAHITKQGNDLAKDIVDGLTSGALTIKQTRPREHSDI